MNKKTYEGIRELRQLHLVDIENLCGSSDLTEQMVRSVRDSYFDQVRPGKYDLFLVTASHHNMLAVSFGWPSATIRFKSGPDGAESLLAQEIDEFELSSCFSGVVIGSGDGYLAPYASRLVDELAFVKVVSLSQCLSGMMRGTGAELVILDSPYGLAA